MGFLYSSPFIRVAFIQMPRTVISVPDMNGDRLIRYFEMLEDSSSSV